jgi:hypothetical protein
MNTLTNEQVGLQIAKQTINKLNKKYGWIFQKPKFELVEIKGAFAKQIISTKQSKYHQKHLRFHLHKCIQKKLNIYNEMLQHYNNTLNGLCVTNTNIE